MQIVSRSAIVPYSAKEMYTLVNDIQAYPHFLPWCTGAKVLHQTPTEITASLEIHKGGISKSFTTRNILGEHHIDMHLVDGPFKSLEGRWEFHPLADQGCKVAFQLAFEFTNRVMQMMLGATFNHAANTLLTAFCERAKHLHHAHAH